MDSNMISSIPLPNLTVPSTSQSAGKAAAVPAMTQQAPKAVEEVSKATRSVEQKPVLPQETGKSAEPLTNAYVVSDKRFTIFKDPVGYVTKYTSLINGEVTYIPDQDVARFLEARQRAHPEPSISIEA